MIWSLKLKLVLLFFIPLLLTVLVYSPIFNGKFMLDDYTFLVEWPLIQNLKHVPELLQGALPSGHAGGYRPLRNIYMAMLRQALGLNAPLYHIHGILIHLFTTALSGLIFFKLIELFNYKNLLDPVLKKKNKHNALLIKNFNDNSKLKHILLVVFGMIVVGLHPMMIEGVAFIQASFDTLGIVIAMLSYYLFLQTFKENKKRYVAISGSLIFAFIAFLWYEVTYVLPLLMIITSLLLKPFLSIKTYLKNYSWILILMAMLGAIFILRTQILALPNRMISSPGGWFTFLIMTRSLYLYGLQVLIPLKSALVHEVAPAITTLVGDPEFYTKLTLWHPKTVIALLGVAGMVLASFKFSRKKPLISLGLSWMLIGLLPVMNIIPTGTVFSERYLYLSIIGFAIFILGIYLKIQIALDRKRLSIVVLLALTVVISLVYGLRSYLRVIEWTDPIYFWKLEVENTPKIGKVHSELALEYRRAKRIEDAISEFILATKLQPFESKFHHNTSLAFYEKGKYEEAALYAEQAMNLTLNYDLGVQSKQLQFLEMVYAKLNNSKRSQAFYAELMERSIDPRISYLHGNISLKNGEIATAEASLRRAIALDPNYEQAYTNLGALLNSQKRASESANLLRQAYSSGLNSVNLLFNLAVAYKMEEDLPNAKRTIELAHQKNPFDQAVEKLYKELIPNIQLEDKYEDKYDE